MEIINKVAQSGILTFNLEELFPAEEIISFDLKEYLFKELILREKDFRTALTTIDWKKYDGKILAIHCSNDAIIPQWAFMLVSVYAQPYASHIYFGTKEEALRGISNLVEEVISDMVSNNEPIPEPLSIKHFSGKFVTRVPPEVHRNLAIEAAEAGISFNRLVNAKLSK